MGNKEARIDGILGYGGVALATVAVTLAIADIGDLDWLEAAVWVLGVIMLAWMVAITVRHVRIHDKGGGRDLLVAGWISIPVIGGLVVLVGGLAAEDRLGGWILELLKSPQAYVMILALGMMLASVAILIDGIDHEARERGHVTGTYGWHRHST
jgi:hypothetical protein